MVKEIEDNVIVYEKLITKLVVEAERDLDIKIVSMSMNIKREIITDVEIPDSNKKDLRFDFGVYMKQIDKLIKTFEKQWDVKIHNILYLNEKIELYEIR